MLPAMGPAEPPERLSTGALEHVNGAVQRLSWLTALTAAADVER